MDDKILNIIVIGLGHQSLEDHLPAISVSRKYNLVGVIDIDKKHAEKIAKEYDTVFAQTYSELKTKIDMKIDVALIAVPHSEYLKIIKKVATDKIDIIKEKPFAVSLKEASELKNIVEQNDISLFVTLQRRYNPIFKSFEQLVKRIRKIYAIEARYTMNIADLASGWRAVKNVAYGGALADMGYHFIDLIIWYFGLPDSITCKVSTGNRANQQYNVEDTAFVDFSYNDMAEDNERVLGNLVVSRVYPGKDEYPVAYGSGGSVSAKRDELIRLDTAGQEMEHLLRLGGWPSAIVDQLEDFHEKITSKNYKGRIIDATEKAVVKQLYKTISIYDNSDIFGEFEEKFADYHNRKYALLSNSGTSAIFSMFEAIDLRSGDEVLRPVYTFHATVNIFICSKIALTPMAQQYTVKKSVLSAILRLGVCRGRKPSLVEKVE